MKKLFVVFVLLASFAFAQESLVISQKLSDLLEATPQTTYVPLGEWTRIDSISLSLAGYGEVDIDSVVTYVGVQVPGIGAFYSTTAYTFLCDPNVAASTKFFTDGCGLTADKDAATVLTSAVVRHGVNILKVTVVPTDGSAAGNYVYAVFTVWGVK